MNKDQAIALFGTRQQDLADALGMTRSAISQWPETLTKRQIDMVIGAAVRLGKLTVREDLPCSTQSASD